MEIEYNKWKNNKTLESHVKSKATKNPKIQYEIGNILCRYLLLDCNFPENRSKHQEDLIADLQKKKIKIAPAVLTPKSTSFKIGSEPEIWSCGSKTMFKLGDFKFSVPRSKYAKWQHLGKDAIFQMLLRYHGILCENGNFWSLHPSICSVLEQKFNVNVECFSSPLNSNFSTFCSLFPDVDSKFGSIGNFFEAVQHFGSGNYMANPPFIEEIMNQAVIAVLELLDRTQSTVFMYLPHWTDCFYINAIRNSKWLIDLHELPKGKHRTYDHIKGTDIVAYFDGLLVVLSSRQDPYSGNKQYLLDVIANH